MSSGCDMAGWQTWSAASCLTDAYPIASGSAVYVGGTFSSPPPPVEPKPKKHTATEFQCEWCGGINKRGVIKCGHCGGNRTFLMED